ncbi:MAG: T9SS type A sorting domain-containing protein [Tannerellaceae bacterium]|jgi:hypothetical protein|nr:T9SS type A sorting domain-containing protein [Tannerellaceae bacterium]
MKKLLFLSVAIGLSLSINAQTDNRIVVPVTTQNSSAEKTTEMFLDVNNGRVLPKPNVTKPKHKANYQYYGQIHNMEYANYYLPSAPDFGAPSDPQAISSFTNLFPDSLAYHFIYDMGTPANNGKSQTFASTGFVFDPYSLSYDMYHTKGLFRDFLGVGYGYRLDTLLTLIDYRLPLGYNPNSPDTLRFFLSYYDVYGKDNGSKDFYTVFYMNNNTRGLLPIINYANPITSKGPYANSPSAPNTAIIDYLLTDQDSSLLPQGYYRMKPLYIAPSGGYAVPPGSCLSVIVQYIPGYNYSIDDSLKVTTWNGNQFVKESIQHNYIAIRNWNYNYSYVNNMFDPEGYNGSLHEAMGERYATDTIDFGRGAFYSGGYYGKPVFYMDLSVSDDDTMHFPNWVEPLFQVYVGPNNMSMGYTTGEGNYTANSTVTMTAINLPGYRFVQWNDGDKNNPRTITVTQDTLFIAEFGDATPGMCHVSVTTNNSNMGIGFDSGSGDYLSGNTVRIFAMSFSGYRFVQWNDGNTDNPRDITVTQDTSFIAEFEVIMHQVSVTANNPSMGTVNGSGTYPENASIVMIANPNSGYRFVQWNDGNTNNPRIVMITQDTNFVAEFEEIMIYHLIVSAGNPAMGIVTGEGYYPENTPVIITATPNNGYRFIQWNDGNTQNPRTITIIRDTSFTAEFEVIMYTVRVTANNASMGEVSGGGTYAANTTATITATPYSGYRFIRWNDGSILNSRTITVTQDITYTALFELGTGIFDKERSTLSVYPNPTRDNVYIVLPENVFSAVFTLHDIQGKVLIRQEIGNQETVQVNSLAAGIYIYNVRTGTQTYQGKIIVNND